MYSLLIQASMALPPQLQEMTPTGTPRVLQSCLAKKYATELVFATASGVFSCHFSWFSSAGVQLALRLLVHIRMGVAGLASMMTSSAPSTGWPLKPFTGISILDCPPQNQTSPMRMFLSVVFSPSLKLISYGPPASGVFMRTLHLPSPSAVTLVFALVHEGAMTTFALALALPHSATLLSRCRTMLSPMMLGS